MRETLARIDEMIRSTHDLNADELGFIGDYLQDLSMDLRRAQHHGPMGAPHMRMPPNPAAQRALPGHIDLLALYDRSGVTDYPDFILYLLERCLELDEHRFVSQVAGYCYGNVPDDYRIHDVLMKGILDKSRSNRLRERFFRVFRYAFREDAHSFFMHKLEPFIHDNEGNHELIGDLLNAAHWAVKKDEEVAGKYREIALTYIQANPEVMGELLSSTKEFLGLPKE